MSKRYDSGARHLAVLACALTGCAGAADPPLFELLSAGRTGIDFVNQVAEDTAFNILNYLNYYNGGGVAVGDVNDDDLPDLFFTSNVGPDRLYLNRGDFRFEDVTERAGVAGGEGWTTGATMADVNGDGHVDLYVSAVKHLGMPGGNVLYVNNGDGTFADRTKEYGLEHFGYSTQALFLDYDGDGDLDMYLLNHSTHEERGRSARPQRERHATAGDRLFRNEGHRFVDVTEDAGIYGGVDGFGLGVVASDFDLDGCIDIYVANDFQENDFLYRNDCDGTFTESIAAAMGHISRSSMGVDAADFDNDGRPDIVVLDMLPEREDILKSSANAESFEVFDLKVRTGYHPQYARNTLQLNRGRARFSEIGFLAGVHATDWSWAALFADLDNDGFKDLFVTNGIYRRPNDLDYIEHVVDPAIQGALRRGIGRATLAALLARMPQVPIPNYAYRNRGDLTFQDMARPWGLAQPGFSTGAAWADLDNDGALDLVVNSIGAPAVIYRNRARETGGHHYLRVVLRGSAANTAGIGARVVIVHDGRTQTLEQMPTRGFQSSVDPRLHFGLGASTRIDSLVVIWPDRRMQLLTDVAVDRTLTLGQSVATGEYSAPAPPEPLFTDVTGLARIEARHRENAFIDFTREPLLLHRVSTEGPALAVGDVNGDGLDDLYAGGAKWQAGRLFVQQRDGAFRESAQPAFSADSLHEDVDALFFDADGDGRADLYVVSAGNEFWGDHDALRDRLYLNDGHGRFRRVEDALPAIFENGSCVAAGDFDRDGDLDLFVGGRVVSRSYGRTPRSALLRNDGKGRFADVTAEIAPGLDGAGMVTSAAWLDYSGDGRLDLIVAGEWMPVRVYRQEDGRLVERTAEAGLSDSHGWWNSVTAADLDSDGRPDLILGNLGLNANFRATVARPLRLYVHDFAGDGRLQQIVALARQDGVYPLEGRDELGRAIPTLLSRFPTHTDFAGRRLEEILPASALKRATVLEAHSFATSIALSGGDARFELRPLPVEAQFAPVRASLAEDFDGDGTTDLLLAGNFHGTRPIEGRYDASYGLLLHGDGKGGFEPLDIEESGLVIDGEVRKLATLRRADGGRLVVVGRNDAALRILRTRHAPSLRLDQRVEPVDGG